MKISAKNVVKGIIAAATAAGAGILAWQTKKSVQDENAFDSTLEPIGEPAEQEQKPEMEEIPATEAEVVEEETEKEDE